VILQIVEDEKHRKKGKRSRRRRKSPGEMRLGPMDGVEDKHAYVQSQWQPSHDFYEDYIEGTITIYNRKNLPLAHGQNTLFPYISSAGGIIAITPVRFH